MIPIEIISRVFRIKHGNSTGSCFTLELDGKQYICTAKHCVENFTDGTLEVFQDREWKCIRTVLVGYGSDGADIAVLATNFQLSPSYSLHSPTKPSPYAQELYFLGFPYGMHIEGGSFNRNFPIPLVKKGILSGVISGGPVTHYIDGHNNPGFSGGPVVYREEMPGSVFCVSAVISSYGAMPEPVFDGQGKETALRYHANTGIVIAHGIEHALVAIRANPIGYELNENWRRLSEL